MKRLITSLKLIVLGLAFTSNLNAQEKETLFVGGIAINNMSLEYESIRTAIHANFMQSELYILEDRYDVAEKLEDKELIGCLGKSCLQRVGEKVGADKVVSFTFDGLKDKIIISAKVVEVKTGAVLKQSISEFENQPQMINRIIELAVNKLLEIPSNADVAQQLSYKKTAAQAKQVAILNNSGPRIGVAFASGSNGDYITRSEKRGGLESTPAVLNLGYQFETQYVGTDNFSGLFEFIFNVGGLEKATIIPSFALLNGFRFGKGNWEIATGPSLTVKKLAEGVMIENKWYLERELALEGFDLSQYDLVKKPDTRGDLALSSNWVIAVGKTFRAGAVNIPVNVYSSINKYGTAFGVSLGLNVSK